MIEEPSSPHAETGGTETPEEETTPVEQPTLEGSAISPWSDVPAPAEPEPELEPEAVEPELEPEAVEPELEPEAVEPEPEAVEPEPAVAAPPPPPSAPLAPAPFAPPVAPVAFTEATGADAPPEPPLAPLPASDATTETGLLGAHPEVLAVAGFVGGFALAVLLRRLGR